MSKTSGAHKRERETLLVMIIIMVLYDSRGTRIIEGGGPINEILNSLVHMQGLSTWLERDQKQEKEEY